MGWIDEEIVNWLGYIFVVTCFILFFIIYIIHSPPVKLPISIRTSSKDPSQTKTLKVQTKDKNHHNLKHCPNHPLKHEPSTFASTQQPSCGTPGHRDKMPRSVPAEPTFDPPEQSHPFQRNSPSLQNVLIEEPLKETRPMKPRPPCSTQGPLVADATKRKERKKKGTKK